MTLAVVVAMVFGITMIVRVAKWAMSYRADLAMGQTNWIIEKDLLKAAIIGTFAVVAYNLFKIAYSVVKKTLKAAMVIMIFGSGIIITMICAACLEGRNLRAIINFLPGWVTVTIIVLLAVPGVAMWFLNIICGGGLKGQD